MMLGSCKKDEAQQFYSGGTAPALASSVSSTIPLAFVNKDQVAVSFSWSNPNYQFINGISSQDVAYTIEIDKTGNNFTGANKVSLSISKDLSVSYTQDQFNNFLLSMNFAMGTASSIDVRLKATMNGNVATLLNSNKLTFSVTPFTTPPKVVLPASGELYITGNAVASDWTNSPPSTQKFTKVSATLYELTIALIGGNSYTFLPTHGSWNDKYSIAIKNDPNEVNGGDFQWQGNDILAPAASGTYKISVNFQTGKFTVVKQ